MSANIYWIPVIANRHSLSVGSKSSFIEKMGLPRRFNEGWLIWLNGAAAMAGGDEKKAIETIIAAVHKHGEIDVVVEY